MRRKIVYLKEKWGRLFGAKHDVLLYDLTSTYFESEPPEAGSGSKKRFGYSRDKRSDCVQVIIALVLTPEGFPVSYEVYPGNTRDTATLGEFLDRIEKRYGKFRRTWLMDRGIPTDETSGWSISPFPNRRNRSMRIRSGSVWIGNA
jgi:transposase